MILYVRGNIVCSKTPTVGTKAGKMGKMLASDATGRWRLIESASREVYVVLEPDEATYMRFWRYCLGPDQSDFCFFPWIPHNILLIV